MVLSWVDWLVVLAYMVFVVWIGIKMSNRASGSIDDFFLSGRNLTWWLIGTSMVASAFASDTPLFITNLVRNYGISGAWYYWNASLGGLLSAFLFAPFWRRTRAVTDAEFREMRYSGKSGKALRSFWAVYQGLLANTISMGWVILAVVKMGKVALGLPPEVMIAGFAINSSVLLTVSVLVIILIYSTLSGLWGIVVIDFFQFFVALFGAIILAILSVNYVGGLDVLKDSITALPNAGADFLNVLPSFGTTAMTFFIVGLTVQWWASPWVDGGIYIAQRTLAAKDERHAVIGRYWGNLAQMGIIVWPWIIVALCSLVVFPDAKFPEIAADPESAYPKMIVTIMPVFLRGLMVAAFFAAFMSTFDTLLNNTSSYMVNDIYKRFLVKNKEPKHYVMTGRLSMLLAAVIAGIIAIISKDILTLSMLVFEIAAGVGLIFILRWMWWRINAWSEISSYIAGIFGAILVNIEFGQMILMRIAIAFTPSDYDAAIQQFFLNEINGFSGFPFRMIFLASFSTIISLVVTMLTKPSETNHLVKFYKQIKPIGPGWRKIQSIAGTNSVSVGEFQFNWSTLVAGFICFFSVFYTLGRLPLGYYTSGSISLLIAIVSGLFLWRNLNDKSLNSN